MHDFEFRIEFHGLIGLVPTGSGGFLLPLPDLEKGSNLDQLPERLAPHLGCFTVPRKHLVAPDDPHLRASLEFRRLPNGERELLVPFRRERLTLGYPGSEAGASTTLSELAEGQKTPADPDAPGERDLAWMPSLARTGIPDAGRFDGRLITREFVPSLEDPFNRLIGTVLVQSGHLGSSGVVEDSAGEAAVHRFASRSGSAVFEQAMFRRIVWEGTVAGEGLELVLTEGFPGVYDERRIGLRPVDGLLELAVYNQETEEIVGVGSGAHPTDPDTDPDFAIGYWMSRGWDSLTADQAVFPDAPGLGVGGSGEACKTGRSLEIAWP